MIRVHVDRGACEGHGMCALTAPDVFRLDADGILEYVEHPPEQLADEIEEAVRMCPTRAITAESTSS